MDFLQLFRKNQGKFYNKKADPRKNLLVLNTFSFHILDRKTKKHRQTPTQSRPDKREEEAGIRFFSVSASPNTACLRLFSSQGFCRYKHVDKHCACPLLLGSYHSAFSLPESDQLSKLFTTFLFEKTQKIRT